MFETLKAIVTKAEPDEATKIKTLQDYIEGNQNKKDPKELARFRLDVERHDVARTFDTKVFLEGDDDNFSRAIADELLNRATIRELESIVAHGVPPEKVVDALAPKIVDEGVEDGSVPQKLVEVCRGFDFPKDAVDRIVRATVHQYSNCTTTPCNATFFDWFSAVTNLRNGRNNSHRTIDEVFSEPVDIPTVHIPVLKQIQRVRAHRMQITFAELRGFFRDEQHVALANEAHDDFIKVQQDLLQWEDQHKEVKRRLEEMGFGSDVLPPPEEVDSLHLQDVTPQKVYRHANFLCSLQEGWWGRMKQSCERKLMELTRGGEGLCTPRSAEYHFAEWTQRLDSAMARTLGKMLVTNALAMLPTLPTVHQAKLVLELIKDFESKPAKERYMGSALRTPLSSVSLEHMVVADAQKVYQDVCKLLHCDHLVPAAVGVTVRLTDEALRAFFVQATKVTGFHLVKDIVPASLQPAADCALRAWYDVVEVVNLPHELWGKLHRAYAAVTEKAKCSAATLESLDALGGHLEDLRSFVLSCGSPQRGLGDNEHEWLQELWKRGKVMIKATSSTERPDFDVLVRNNPCDVRVRDHRRVDVHLLRNKLTFTQKFEARLLLRLLDTARLIADKMCDLAHLRRMVPPDQLLGGLCNVTDDGTVKMSLTLELTRYEPQEQQDALVDLYQKLVRIACDHDSDCQSAAQDYPPLRFFLLSSLTTLLLPLLQTGRKRYEAFHLVSALTHAAPEEIEQAYDAVYRAQHPLSEQTKWPALCEVLDQFVLCGRKGESAQGAKAEMVMTTDWSTTLRSLYKGRSPELYEVALPIGAFAEGAIAVLRRAQMGDTPRAVTGEPTFSIVVPAACSAQHSYELRRWAEEAVQMLESRSLVFRLVIIVDEGSHVVPILRRCASVVEPPQHTSATMAGKDGCGVALGGPRSGKSTSIMTRFFGSVPHESVHMLVVESRTADEVVCSLDTLRVAKGLHIVVPSEMGFRTHLIIFSIVHFRALVGESGRCALIPPGVRIALEVVNQPAAGWLHLFPSIPVEQPPVANHPPGDMLSDGWSAANLTTYDKVFTYLMGLPHQPFDRNVYTSIAMYTAASLARPQSTMPMSAKGCEGKRDGPSVAQQYMLVPTSQRKVLVVVAVPRRSSEAIASIESMEGTGRVVFLHEQNASNGEQHAMCEHCLEAVFGRKPTTGMVLTPGLTMALLRQVLLLWSAAPPGTLIGDTGCGKTLLQQTVAQLMGSGFACMDVTTGTTLKLITEFLKDKVLPQLRSGTTLVFFDEVNTSCEQESLKLLLFDKSWPHDKSVHKELQEHANRMHVVSAANPYIRTDLCVGSHLVFAVQEAVHPSFEVTSWTLPTLTSDHIRQVVGTLCSRLMATPGALLTEALPAIHKFYIGRVRHIPVNFRDATRVVRCVVCLEKVLAAMGETGDLQLRAVHIALHLMYIVPLGPAHRKELRESLENLYPEEGAWGAVEGKVLSYMDPCKLEGLVLHASLRELLTTMLLCVYCNIHVLAVGPPGTSKSLAAHLLVESLSVRNSRRPSGLELVVPYFFQCSAKTTEASLRDTLSRVQVGGDRISLLCIDEIAAASTAQGNPLRSLNNFLDGTHNAVCLATSNAHVDRSLLSRFLIVPCSGFDDHEFQEAQNNLGTPPEDAARLAGFVEAQKSLSLQSCGMSSSAQVEALRQVGHRDIFAHLRHLQVVGARTAEDDEGRYHKDLLQSFGYGLRYVAAPEEDHPLFGDSKPEYETIEEELVRSRWDSESSYRRPLLLVASCFSNVLCLFDQAARVKRKVVFITGCVLSRTPEMLSTQLHQFRVAMERGDVAVLLGVDYMYDSILDVVNARYATLGHKRVARVAIGGASEMWEVHPNFLCYIVELPNSMSLTQGNPSWYAFCDRFERRRLDAIPPNAKSAAQSLRELSRRFLRHKDYELFTEKEVDFVADSILKYRSKVVAGYHDTLPSRVEFSLLVAVADRNALVSIAQAKGLPQWEMATKLRRVASHQLRTLVRAQNRIRVCVLTSPLEGTSEEIPYSLGLPEDTTVEYVDHNTPDTVLEKMLDRLVALHTIVLVYKHKPRSPMQLRGYHLHALCHSLHRYAHTTNVYIVAEMPPQLYFSEELCPHRDFTYTRLDLNLPRRVQEHLHQKLQGTLPYLWCQGGQPPSLAAFVADVGAGGNAELSALIAREYEKGRRSEATKRELFAELVKLVPADEALELLDASEEPRCLEALLSAIHFSNWADVRTAVGKGKSCPLRPTDLGREGFLPFCGVRFFDFPDLRKGSTLCDNRKDTCAVILEWGLPLRASQRLISDCTMHGAFDYRSAEEYAHRVLYSGNDANHHYEVVPDLRNSLLLSPTRACTSQHLNLWRFYKHFHSDWEHAEDFNRTVVQATLDDALMQVSKRADDMFGRSRLAEKQAYVCVYLTAFPAMPYNAEPRRVYEWFPKIQGGCLPKPSLDKGVAHHKALMELAPLLYKVLYFFGRLTKDFVYTPCITEERAASLPLRHLPSSVGGSLAEGLGLGPTTPLLTAGQHLLHRLRKCVEGYNETVLGIVSKYGDPSMVHGCKRVRLPLKPLHTVVCPADLCDWLHRASNLAPNLRNMVLRQTVQVMAVDGLLIDTSFLDTPLCAVSVDAALCGATSTPRQPLRPPLELTLEQRRLLKRSGELEKVGSYAAEIEREMLKAPYQLAPVPIKEYLKNTLSLEADLPSTLTFAHAVPLLHIAAEVARQVPSHTDQGLLSLWAAVGEPCVSTVDLYATLWQCGRWSFDGSSPFPQDAALVLHFLELPVPLQQKPNGGVVDMELAMTLCDAIRARLDEEEVIIPLLRYYSESGCLVRAWFRLVADGSGAGGEGGTCIACSIEVPHVSSLCDCKVDEVYCRECYPKAWKHRAACTSCNTESVLRDAVARKVLASQMMEELKGSTRSTPTEGMFRCSNPHHAEVEVPLPSNGSTKVFCYECHEDKCVRCNKLYHYHCSCGDAHRYLTDFDKDTRSMAEYGRKKESAQASLQAIQDKIRRLRQREEEFRSDEQYKARTARYCPNCSQVVERTGGCGAMVCGRNTEGDPNTQHGCGKSFSWDSAQPYRPDQTSGYFIGRLRTLQAQQNELEGRARPRRHPAHVVCALCNTAGPEGPRLVCIHCERYTLCLACVQAYGVDVHLRTKPGHVLRRLDP
eukprot:Sspe_Gene.18325::Locus_6578_Transcript_1_1_Confidence_1.000_Length_9547::g.18325::m.18325